LLPANLYDIYDDDDDEEKEEEEEEGEKEGMKLTTL
jgi:hypothetical protein